MQFLVGSNDSPTLALRNYKQLNKLQLLQHQQLSYSWCISHNGYSINIMEGGQNISSATSADPLSWKRIFITWKSFVPQGQVLKILKYTHFAHSAQSTSSIVITIRGGCFGSLILWPKKWGFVPFTDSWPGYIGNSVLEYITRTDNNCGELTCMGIIDFVIPFASQYFQWKNFQWESWKSN